MNTFREEVRDWLSDNCPNSARGSGEQITIGSIMKMSDPALLEWRRKLGAKGWTIPTWPKEYGGGGLTPQESHVLVEELRAIKARVPLVGQGVTMIGPTLLEFGTEDQKRRHIPKIALGDVMWCQGYSEPGAGSDLASLQTRAVDKGDYFEVNGQKTWTSGAQFADWIFVLVRTDTQAPKHEGISFVLMDLAQEGIDVRPIKLISGTSAFCDTFFDNAVADKVDLVGQLNKGWSVGKRLLQYERSGHGGLSESSARRVLPEPDLSATAKKYIGENSEGKIADAAMREEVIRFAMNTRCFKLTQQRAREENASGKAMGATTSIFKLYGANLSRDSADLQCRLMGSQGNGWAGNSFSRKELEWSQHALAYRANTIYGGTAEIQKNIIAKRVLNLPE